MHQEQRQKTQELLQAGGITRAVFANLNSVKWLTGLTPPVQLGPPIFAAAPPLVWYEAGQFTLVVVDSYAAEAAAFGQQPNCALVSYQGYSFEEPLAGAAHLAAVLPQVLAPGRARSGQVGLEERDLPLWLAGLLHASGYPDGDRVAIDGWLEPLRMVKTGEELAKLRANFALTDIGQAAARRTVAADQREIDLWTAIHSAIQQAAGRRVPLGNDCVVGHRQANMGGWPLDYKILPHDAVIVDLGTSLNGYWSDSCATYYAGEPTAQQAAMHRTVSEALELGISLVRPGAIAREIDREVRRLIAAAGYPVYPHHTGHGVGVSSHEEPRLTPYNDQALRAGMVIMLEPGIYRPGETGVRLEDAVLVTATGAEVLTKHDKSLP